MKIIGGGHILEVALHPFLSQILLGVSLPVPRYYFRVIEPNVSQLVP